MNSIGIMIKYERMKQNMSQEALAEGICSNTYLSKIENLSVDANQEIIELLVDVLGYTYNKTDIEDFKVLYNRIMETYLYDDDSECIFSNQDESLLESLYMSSVSLDVILLRAFVDAMNDREISSKFEEIVDVTILNDELLYLYHLISIFKNKDYVLLDPKIKDFNDNIGIITYYKGSTLFLKGEYHKAAEYASHAYQLFSANGNIKWMINTSFTESACASNVNNMDEFIKISNRILNLNRTLNSASTNYFVHYNLGSSYLVYGDYEQSKYHLEKSLEYEYVYNESAYEKLSFLYLFNSEFDKAKETISKLESLKDSKLLLEYMLKSKNNLKSDEYISLLETCFSLESKEHHGRSMLFGTLLYTAYKSTYQYPKAIKLLETMSFQELPLFFKNPF